MQITGPIAAIIVSLIVTLGTLYGTNAFAPNTYATVKFDGGYQKIGVIKSEQIFTEATISLNDSIIKRGKIRDIVEYLNDAAKQRANELGGIDKVTLKEGIEIDARAGINWVGSESSFRLTTDSLNERSTKENLLLTTNVIRKLESLESKAKQERVETAKKSLDYSAAPKESFLLSTMINALQK